MKILLAQDVRTAAKSLAALLKKNHFTVDAVSDGTAVSEYSECGNYDAIILDMESENPVILKQLRKRKNGLPILLLSSSGAVEDIVQGLDGGADDYIRKPFDERELSARLRVLTRNRAAQSDSAFRFGNVTLDRVTNELYTPSGKIRLANKEFQVMEALMSAPHHLISTERFMEKIWGYNSDTEVNVVWVYISYLRKKLLQLQADIRIKSSRNVGFCLEEIG